MVKMNVIAICAISCITSIAAAEGRIVITEIMYNPASNEQRGETEWVEIANIGDETVEMVDWRLDDEDRGDWGRFELTLKPGEVAVLFNRDALKDDKTFFAAWGADVPAKGDPESEQRTAYKAVGVEWASLGNRADAENEKLQLLDADDKIICEVNYQTQGDWPDVGRNGASIWLADLTADLNDGKAWKVSKNNEHGARHAQRTDFFSSRDVGSPGFVPGLDGPVTAVAKSEESKKKNTRKGDDEIDY